MTLYSYRLPHFVTGQAFVTPTPANENLQLLLNCPLTPAEIMQWARRRKTRLSRELDADPRLWTCPEHRRDWNATVGIEKLTLWQCYGILDVS
jgi:hypothetical protein